MSGQTLWASLWQLPQCALQGLVRAYRFALKPWLGNACRFEPTCSAYALQALEQHGALVGTALSSYRILRCNPWCEGGCDAVPSAPLPLFSRWTGGHTIQENKLP